MGEGGPSARDPVCDHAVRGYNVPLDLKNENDEWPSFVEQPSIKKIEKSCRGKFEGQRGDAWAEVTENRFWATERTDRRRGIIGRY